MMTMLRELAGGTRSVVLVMHATASLELCDEDDRHGPRRRCSAFQGSPAAALGFFGAEALVSNIDVRSRRSAPVAQWRERDDVTELLPPTAPRAAARSMPADRPRRAASATR